LIRTICFATESDTPQDPATSNDPAPAVSGQVNRGDKIGRQFQSAWKTKYP